MPVALTASHTGPSFVTFRVDDYFQFINFHLYVMNDPNNESNFLLLYAILSGLLLALIGLLISTTGKTFEAQKSEDSKDSTNILLKSLSILLCLFLYIFQMPLITLLLQGFLCGEDKDTPYGLASITCDDILHKILIIISSLMLIIYGVFLYSEVFLYTSNGFEKVVPWGSYETKMGGIRVLIKIILTFGFVFNKSGSFRGVINIVCFFL